MRLRLVLPLLLLTATPAVAADKLVPPPRPSKAVVYEAITVAQLEDMLRSRAIPFETIRADGRDSFLRAEVGRFKIILGFNDKGTGLTEDVRLYAGFQSRSPPTLDQLNVWNGTQRWGRAYLDAAGDPVLEADLDLSGGVLQGHILDSIVLFGAAVDAFGEAIGFQ